MPDRVLERKAGQYKDTYPEVVALLLQANSLLPKKPGSERHSPSLEARDQFREAVKAFKIGPVTKDTIMRLWQTRYNVLGSIVGSKFEVADLDYHQDEIEGLAHLADPRKLVYVPDQLETTTEGLVLASKMYPKMRAWADKPDNALLRVTNGFSQRGWVHVESDWKTPHTNTTQSDLEVELTKLGEEYPAYVWKGQRLATYVIGSKDSNDLTRHHFDESGWVRLFGSFFDGRVLDANFHSSGRLSFGWRFHPQLQLSVLGGRFEGAKP